MAKGGRGEMAINGGLNERNTTRRFAYLVSGFTLAAALVAPATAAASDASGCTLGVPGTPAVQSVSTQPTTTAPAPAPSSLELSSPTTTTVPPSTTTSTAPSTTTTTEAPMSAVLATGTPDVSSLDTALAELDILSTTVSSMTFVAAANDTRRGSPLESEFDIANAHMVTLDGAEIDASVVIEAARQQIIDTGSHTTDMTDLYAARAAFLTAVTDLQDLRIALGDMNLVNNSAADQTARDGAVSDIVLVEYDLGNTLVALDDAIAYLEANEAPSVGGAVLTQERITVGSGLTVRFAVADLDSAESGLVAKIVEAPQLGSVDLTSFGDVCQLTYTAQFGALGTDEVEVTVDVDGRLITTVLEFEVVPGPAAQPPAVLALTGPSSAQTLLLIAFALIGTGCVTSRAARALEARVD